MTPKELADQMYLAARAAAARKCKDDDYASAMAYVAGRLSVDLAEVLELLPKAKFNHLVEKHKQRA
jgi:hypothetical protein